MKSTRSGVVFHNASSWLGGLCDAALHVRAEARRGALTDAALPLRAGATTPREALLHGACGGLVRLIGVT